MVGELVYIWDSQDPKPLDGSLIITLDFSEKSESIISIPAYVEQNANHIRDCFLKWTFDLGEKKFAGKPLVDLLSIDKDFSYWWMSPFIEKHPYNFPVKSAIFLFALDEILMDITPKSIIVKTNQEWLNQTLKDFCIDKGINFESHKESLSNNSHLSANSTSNRMMLNALKSIARHILRIRKFKQSPKDAWFNHDKSILLSGYFVNFNKIDAEKGIFSSAYWGDLPELLSKTGHKINWLHHNSYFSPNESLKLVKNFNEEAKGQDFHAFVEGTFSILAGFRVLTKWIRLNILSLRIRNKNESFKIRKTGLSMWPLFKDLWEDWIRGPQSISNLFVLESFKSSLKSIPKQNIGLYISENNAFERAFAYAWKRNGHGLLVGVQHSTIRFWDLRYFNDRRILIDKTPNSIPQPDLMAINGPVAETLLNNANYPEEKLVQVEAIRYLNNDLSNLVKTRADNGKIILLVLGDISFESTSAMMQLLIHLPENLKNLLNILVKPHPICLIKKSDFPQLDYELFSGSFNEIFQKECIVYGANPTSSSVDGYLAGLPVIVHRDESSLNLSPLQNIGSVKFVSNTFELSSALSEILDKGLNPIKPKDFFWLDSELPKWHSFLDNADSYLVNRL